MKWINDNRETTITNNNKRTNEMTTYIPTVWTNDINNTTVVGIFQDKDEAIRALFKKMVEENLLSFNENFEDFTQDELIELVYDDYTSLEDEDESTNQNLINLAKFDNEGMFKEFGRSWGYKMETE